MPAPHTRFAPRNSALIRQWRVLVMLRNRAHTLAEMAGRLGCTERTVRRDLEALQLVPFPIRKIGNGPGDGPGIWHLGEFKGWPRNESTPTDAPTPECRVS